MDTNQSTGDNKNDDNENQHSQDFGNLEESQEHETHVTALVLLSLATIIIVAVILSVKQQATSLNPGTYDNQGTQVTQPAGESHGAGIPVRSVSTNQKEGMDGFPSELTLPDDAEIVQNYSSQLGENHTQRIVVFDTNANAADLISRYESWVQNNDFQLESTRNKAGGGAVVAADGENRLTIAVTNNGEGARLQFNYVTTQ